MCQTDLVDEFCLCFILQDISRKGMEYNSTFWQSHMSLWSPELINHHLGSSIMTLNYFLYIVILSISQWKFEGRPNCYRVVLFLTKWKLWNISLFLTQRCKNVLRHENTKYTNIIVKIKIAFCNATSRNIGYICRHFNCKTEKYVQPLIVKSFIFQKDTLSIQYSYSITYVWTHSCIGTWT